MIVFLLIAILFVLYMIYAANAAPIKAGAKAEAEAKKREKRRRSQEEWGRKLELQYVEDALQAIYCAGVTSIPTVKTPADYIENLKKDAAAYAKASADPAMLRNWVFDRVSAENAEDVAVAKAVAAARECERRKNSKNEIESAETVLVTSPAEQERIVRTTLDKVFGKGDSNHARRRAPGEYLGEIERQYRPKAPGESEPIVLSHAVLDVLRRDCAGDAAAMLAIDLARSANLPVKRIQYFTASQQASDPRLKELEDRLARMRPN